MNYLYILPNEIIDIIYLELHKKNFNNVLNDINSFNKKNIYDININNFYCCEICNYNFKFFNKKKLIKKNYNFISYSNNLCYNL